MTALLFAAAAAFGALGSGLAAAAALVAAAAAAAASGSSVYALGTWVAALGAGLSLQRPARSLALPTLGAGAVLASGGSPNVAAVLALWLVGTVGAALSVSSRDRAGRRRAGLLCLSDVPLVLAILASSLRGFEAWPSSGAAIAPVALLVTAAAKSALAGGDVAGLMVVRAQALLAVLLAVDGATQATLDPLAAVGALAFAVAPSVADGDTLDEIQESGLLLVAAAGAASGWGPRGWVWGVLACGTLVHYLRLSERDARFGPALQLVVRGGSLGLPFAAVVIAELEGAARGPSWVAATIAIALPLGLALRVRGVVRPRTATASGSWQAVAPLSVVAAIAAAVFAPALTLPRSISAAPVQWPPVWAVAATVLVGAAGYLRPGLVRGAARRAARAPIHIEAGPVTGRDFSRRVIAGLVAALSALAIALWVIGAARGFL